MKKFQAKLFALALTFALSTPVMFLSLMSLPAAAIEPFIITDVRVEGMERLEAGTIYNYLPLKVGDELNDEEARLSIKELFATGFFKDVTLEQDGTVLLVKVVERPSISEIEIVGNKVLDDEALKRALEQADLVEGRILNSASLGQVEQEIKNTYLSLGRYSATVETETEDLDRNRVAITLQINEGRVATIKKINIIGARTIPARIIIEQMSLRDKRGFGLFTRRNQYSKQKLEADIEAIRSYYLDRGYHDFKIVDRSVDISPNKQNIFISISIDEGGQFSFAESEFEVAGDAKEVGKTVISNLDELITVKPGEAFSRKVVNASRAAIATKYADQGYAFVEVRPVYETDRDAKTVKTVFVIDPKQRVYVRKVEITGNTHTRDQVIRRELRQYEGSWYSAGAVNRSRARLQRLGYFDSVDIETPEVPGTSDQVDMKVMVSERNTGAISFSLGYSDTDGTLLGLSYSQRNLLGTGRQLDVTVDSSDTARTASVNFVDPFHTADGISRGLSLSRRRVDTAEVDSAEYILNSTSAGVNYRIPIAETNSLNLGFVLENVTVETTASSPREFERDIQQTGASGTNLVTNLGVSKDTRNDFYFPTDGSSSSASVEISSPGSDYEYYKFSLQGTYYIPLAKEYAIKTGVGLGLGGGFGDSDGLPFFRRYYAGGSHSVRGFDGRSLGPLSSRCTRTDTTTPVGDACNAGSAPRSVGGDRRLLLNTEFLFPAFGAEGGNDKRFGFFLDGGMVFGEGFELASSDDPNEVKPITNTGVSISAMRWSTGVVFNWFSPIGPFSMSYAQPLNEQDGDNTEKFQLTVGSVFR